MYVYGCSFSGDHMLRFLIQRPSSWLVADLEHQGTAISNLFQKILHHLNSEGEIWSRPSDIPVQLRKWRFKHIRRFKSIMNTSSQYLFLDY